MALINITLATICWLYIIALAAGQWWAWIVGVVSVGAALATIAVQALRCPCGRVPRPWYDAGSIADLRSGL